MEHQENMDLRFPLERDAIAPEVLRAALGLMTEGELAGALGITETTLASWRKSGSGPIPVKIGRGVFYTCAMVEAWLHVTQEDQCDELEKELEGVLKQDKVANGKGRETVVDEPNREPEQTSLLQSESNWVQS